MRGALNDKFLLALLGVLLLAVLAFGYIILEGPSLMKEQKAKAIVIAMNDLYVREQVVNILSHENLDYQAFKYRFNEVVPARFHETGPGIDRYRTLLTVKIIVGLEGSPGTNVIAFVDLEENRVAYVGFEKRGDVNNDLPMESFKNTSIVNTGYNFSLNLTEEQKADMVKIALAGKGIQEDLRRRNYSVNRIGMRELRRSGPGYDYVEIYPAVDFMVDKVNEPPGSKVSEPGYLVSMAVDLNKGKVVDVTTYFDASAS